MIAQDARQQFGAGPRIAGVQRRHLRQGQEQAPRALQHRCLLRRGESRQAQIVGEYARPGGAAFDGLGIDDGADHRQHGNEPDDQQPGAERGGERLHESAGAVERPNSAMTRS